MLSRADDLSPKFDDLGSNFTSAVRLTEGAKRKGSLLSSEQKVRSFVYLLTAKSVPTRLT